MLQYFWPHTVVRDSSAVRRLFVRLAGAVGRQSALHKENSGFAAATLRRHISTFHGYRILFFSSSSSFFYSFITILPSKSGVTLHYSTILPHSLSRVVVSATLHTISVNAHFTRFL